MATVDGKVHRRELLRIGMAASTLSIAGLGITSLPGLAIDEDGNGRVSGPGQAVAKI